MVRETKNTMDPYKHRPLIDELVIREKFNKWIDTIKAFWDHTAKVHDKCNQPKCIMYQLHMPALLYPDCERCCDLWFAANEALIAYKTFSRERVRAMVCATENVTEDSSSISSEDICPK